MSDGECDLKIDESDFEEEDIAIAYEISTSTSSSSSASSSASESESSSVYDGETDSVCLSQAHGNTPGCIYIYNICIIIMKF